MNRATAWFTWVVGFALATVPGGIIGWIFGIGWHIGPLLAAAGLLVQTLTQSKKQKRGTEVHWLPPADMLRPGEYVVYGSVGVSASHPRLGGGVVVLGADLLEMDAEARNAWVRHELGHIRHHHLAFIASAAGSLLWSLHSNLHGFPTFLAYLSAAVFGILGVAELMRLRPMGLVEVAAMILIVGASGILMGHTTAGVEAIYWALRAMGAFMLLVTPLLWGVELAADLYGSPLRPALRAIDGEARWRALSALYPHPTVRLRLWLDAWATRNDAERAQTA